MGTEPYSSFFTETRLYSPWRVSMITSSDTQPSCGGRGNKVGAVTHMLHWRVLKFREIKWLSKSHTMMNAPISQILLHLVFCRWELMPWRRCLSPERAQILLLPFVSIFQFLIQNTCFFWAKPFRKTTGFQLFHPPQPLYTLNHLIGGCYLAKWPVVSLATKLLSAQNLLNQRPHDGCTKN